jgi:hypothetical protein
MSRRIESNIPLRFAIVIYADFAKTVDLTVREGDE